MIGASVLSLLLTLSLFPGVTESISFTIINKCHATIWPGFLSGANSPPIPTTGFVLRPGASRTLHPPSNWSGRFWARTHCSRSPADSRLTCLTADCGSGLLTCEGAGAKPPATLAEFTLNGGSDGKLDFYDVSLVDGYNLPLLIIPRRLGGRGPTATGLCSPTGCLVDLNGACPAELRLRASPHGRSLACRSACEAFGDPRFCCSEAYNTPQTCGPSDYSMYFKHACPRSYSYAYDDTSSTFTCPSGADYVILFCPLPYTSQKLLGAHKDGSKLPLVNTTMMYLHSRQ